VRIEKAAPWEAHETSPRLPPISPSPRLRGEGMPGAAR